MCYEQVCDYETHKNMLIRLEIILCKVVNKYMRYQIIMCNFFDDINSSCHSKNSIIFNNIRLVNLIYKFINRNHST